MNSRTLIKSDRIGLLILLALMVFLSACGKNDQAAKASQVVVKVGSSEVTVYTLNQALSTVPNVTSENADQVKKQVVAKLVDQQLLLNQAMSEKLDRTPEVLSALEAAKRDIVSRAYLNKLVTTSVNVSDQDIQKYYDTHPELFSGRRIYTLQVITLADSGLVKTQIEEQVAQRKSMQEIAEFLQGKNVPIKAASYTKPAEELPLEIVPELNQLKDGQTALFELNGALHAVYIVKSISQPIDFNTSKKFIKNYFLNVRGKEIVADKMKALRKETKIEYVGDFKSLESLGEPVPAIDTKPLASTAPPAVAKEPTGTQAVKQPSSADSTVEKGLAGLK